MTNTRRYIAAALLTTLLIPFQNCGEKTDLAGYGSNSSSSAAAPKLPEITDFTPDTTVAFFESAAIGVTAKGEEPLTYEWKKDGVVIPNQTKQLLNTGELVGTTPATPSTNIIYTVKVTDKDGEFITKDIRVTVARSAAQLAAPVISAAGLVDTTPIPSCVNGSNHTMRVLSATATGVKLTYAWSVLHNYNGAIGQTTDPVMMNAQGQATTNIARFFDDGVYLAKCILYGTYTVTVTDYFGQTATRSFDVRP